ncbi:Oleosin 18.5 kDa [Raphanus sativus]|nr:Oleosin 18.5 kDa [Raphanus sativus]
MADTARTHHDVTGRDQYPILAETETSIRTDDQITRCLAKTTPRLGRLLKLLPQSPLEGPFLSFPPNPCPGSHHSSASHHWLSSSGGFGIAAITVFSWIYKYATGEHPQGSDKLDSARMKLGGKAQDIKDRGQYYGQQHTGGYGQQHTGGEHDRDRTRGTHHTTTTT